ncbi:ElaB/YqjD/DUF883 family membrane-anchored ribosome-binding protein [Providencia alcalifaciens]|nr:ElaB/YqjD/DUF883 family membrane-anchored ribosome-binding protein [Providencia alcalifaciens]
MDASKKQELIIVNAISQMVIPSDAFENSEFKEIISNFKEAQNKVCSDLSDIERARNEVKDGGMIGNLWNNRKDKLQDAQFDLNKSVGLLTKQSSDLILFNTAISKVLVSQQNLLHEQQEMLRAQAGELAAQNKNIKEHQIKLSSQQDDIVKANNGLLEAKGLTREQAEKLVGCVKRVEAAEQKMKSSNQKLEHSFTARIVACEGHAESIKAEVDEALYNYGQKTVVMLEEFRTECHSALEGLRGQLSDVELKIQTESEVRKLAVTSVEQELNQLIDELQNKQEASDEKLLSELGSTKESLESQISSLSLNLVKRDAEFSKKNKRLVYFSTSALIVSGLSLAASAYVYLSV